MLKIIKRIDLSAQTGEFFSTNEWKWNVSNMTTLMKVVSEQEISRNFEVNIQNVDWDMYLQRYILGIRKYILKENLDTLPYARSRLNK